MSSIDPKTGLSTFTKRLLYVAIGFGIAHHIDHILRVDHSGWPFIAKVTPFTFSLLAYPILAFVLIGPARSFWLRWATLVAGTAATLAAHIWIETPRMQYAMWAYNRSLEPQLSAVRNLCGIESGPLGMASVVIAMELNVLLVTAAIAMLSDGLRVRARARSQAAR